jgi:hypothetical protein
MKRGSFGGFRDKALSKGVELAVNSRIRRFGKVLKFQLDSREKTIELEILLKGEHEPLRVTVERYEIVEEGGRYYLLAENIVTSREWINTVAESYLVGQRFEIPERYAKILLLVG